MQYISMLHFFKIILIALMIATPLYVIKVNNDLAKTEKNNRIYNTIMKNVDNSNIDRKTKDTIIGDVNIYFGVVKSSQMQMIPHCFMQYNTEQFADNFNKWFENIESLE